MFTTRVVVPHSLTISKKLRQHFQGVRHLFYFIYPREFTVVNFTVPVLIQHVNQCG